MRTVRRWEWMRSLSWADSLWIGPATRARLPSRSSRAGARWHTARRDERNINLHELSDRTESRRHGTGPRRLRRGRQDRLRLREGRRRRVRPRRRDAVPARLMPRVLSTHGNVVAVDFASKALDLTVSVSGQV